jgi:hypothetical protein
LADLARFITDFYARKAHGVQQTIDSDYTAFVWSKLVALPEIRVGHLDPVTSDQGVAEASASTSKKKLDSALAYTFHELDKAVTREQTAQDLEAEYGDRLRIGVDEETCWFSITGSHNRVRCLSVHSSRIEQESANSPRD